MKKQFISSQWLRSTALLLLGSMLTLSTSAQTFNAPITPETTYPGVGGAIGLSGHTSAYSVENINVPSPGRNLVLAGWDDPAALTPAGVSWQLLNPMFTPVAQGVIPYTNVRDVEVGFIDLGSVPHILVAYYDNAAPGHRLDIYSMATATPVWVSTTPLSSMATYTRISMDCHMRYATAIAWEDAGGINTIVGLNNGTPFIQLSGILTLASTIGEGTVDLAFSHNQLLNVQYVYYNPNSGNITQSEYDFWTAIYLTGGTITPTINDLNMVGTCRPCGDGTPSNIPVITKCPYMNIDCPDHYSVDNWAYTYTTDNTNISVRYLNLNSSTVANTVVVNDGSVLPNMPINGNQNVHPFCTYNTKCMPTIVVAWHTSTLDPMTGQTAGYVGLRMDETGSVLLSPPDYLTVAANPTWASMTPVLSMSKKDDLFQQLYTVFPEYDPGALDFRMQNKYSNFCGGFFKGAPDEGTAEHSEPFCNDDKNIAEFKRAYGITTINTSPNPFASTFTINIPLEYLKDETRIVLTNVLGTTIAEYNGPANEATAFFEKKTKGLAAGSYFLNVNINDKVKETLKLSKTE